MKATKFLPCAAAVLCVPGIALRAMHLQRGFDIDTGLPILKNGFFLACIGLFVLCAVLFAVLSAPLRKRREATFEQLLGTRSAGFRMTAVVCGLLLAAGGACYLYLTMTTAEQDAAVWARVMEMLYAVVTVAAGVSMIVLTKAQGSEMTASSAKVTLLPLLWGCIHLLVTYRMTCVDPKLPSFAFGLLADVLLALGFYQLARLLFAKPHPAWFAFFSAMAVVLAVSDLGGYGLSYLMGGHVVVWSAKMLLRSGMTTVGCVLLFAELCLLSRSSAAQREGE